MHFLKSFSVFVLAVMYFTPLAASSGRSQNKVTVAGTLPQGWQIVASVTHEATIEERKCMHLRSTAGPFTNDWTGIFNIRQALKQQTKTKSARAGRDGAYELDLVVYDEPTGDCGYVSQRIWLALYDSNPPQNYVGEFVPAAQFNLTLDSHELLETELDIQCLKKQNTIRMSPYDCSWEGKKTIDLKLKRPVEGEYLILNFYTDDSNVH